MLAYYPSTRHDIPQHRTLQNDHSENSQTYTNTVTLWHSQSILPEAHPCWDMGETHVIFTADALCVYHAFQLNFQLFIAQRCPLCRKFLVISWRYSQLCAVIFLSHWSALDRTNYLSVTTAKSQMINPGDRALKFNGLRFLSIVDRKSGAGTVRKCGGCWWRRTYSNFW